MPDPTPNTVRHRYCVYGLVVESELRLSSVQSCCDERAPAISITEAPDGFFAQRAAGLRRDSEEWIRHVVLDDGSVYMRVNSIFETIVTADGRLVASAKLGTVDDRTFEANLVTFALTTSLTLQGEECLHATVVAFDGKAIGLLGSSGAGKSTLSACLLAQGASLITDDMLRVTFAGEGVLAHSGPHRLKLLDDSARHFLPGAVTQGSFNTLSGKTMFEPSCPTNAESRGTPLSALVWLAEEEAPSGDPEVSIQRLTGIERVKILTRSTMNIRYVTPERLMRQLRFAEQMARAVPIFSIRYPRDYAALPAVAEALRQIINP